MGELAYASISTNQSSQITWKSLEIQPRRQIGQIEAMETSSSPLPLVKFDLDASSSLQGYRYRSETRVPRSVCILCIGVASA